MTMDTNLNIHQIENILYNSCLFDKRNDIMLTNLSFGLLNHEADFVAINKSNYLTEVEIKRSLADFKKDFEKDVFHKDERVYKFFYFVPVSIKDKVMDFLKTETALTKIHTTFGEHYFPHVMTYSEEGRVEDVKESGSLYTGYGRKLFLEEIVKVSRLVSIRYWNLFQKTLDVTIDTKNERL